ncbi:MAG: aldehyde ferredoxin oxidoreductase N-terminal domain-containing protein [Anaerolineae bacterium]
MSDAARYGYTGKILRVDLSSGQIGVEEPDDVFYRTYMGGWGFIGYYLLKEVPAHTDPLGPENLLIFAPGRRNGRANRWLGALGSRCQVAAHRHLWRRRGWWLVWGRVARCRL